MVPEQLEGVGLVVRVLLSNIVDGGEDCEYQLCSPLSILLVCADAYDHHGVICDNSGGHSEIVLVHLDGGECLTDRLARYTAGVVHVEVAVA